MSILIPINEMNMMQPYKREVDSLGQIHNRKSTSTNHDFQTDVSPFLVAFPVIF